jgi:hypothetical protein
LSLVQTRVVLNQALLRGGGVREEPGITGSPYPVNNPQNPLVLGVVTRTAYFRYCMYGVL